MPAFTVCPCRRKLAQNSLALRCPGALLGYIPTRCPNDGHYADIGLVLGQV